MNAEIRAVKTGAEQALADAYAAAKAKLPGDGKVVALRDAAFRRFEAEGLPNRRIEEWKYTDLRALMREARPIAAAPDDAAKARAGEAGRLVGDIDARRIRFCRRDVRARNCPICRTLSPGVRDPLDGRGAGRQ